MTGRSFLDGREDPLQANNGFLGLFALGMTTYQ